MSQSSRYRVMHKFWLDITKPGEDWLDEQIHQLKATRQFTTLLRDGLRLILDLRAGKLEVLFELFPWVQARLNAEQGGATSDLQAKLDHLETLLLAQGSSHVMQPIGGPKPLQGGPQPLAIPSMSKPVFDDEDDSDLLVVSKTKGDNSSVQNFLRSAFALQGEVYQPRP